MDVSQSANQLYMLGMLNAFKTGNPLLDGLFIVLLPTLMGYISQFAYMILAKIIQSAKKVSNQDYYTQKIEYANMAQTNNCNNYQIYVAISMYANSLNLDIKNTIIESISNSDCNTPGMPKQLMPGYSNTIKQYKLLRRPSINGWIVATSDIELMFDQIQESQKHQNGTTYNYTLYSVHIRSKTSKNIQEFIDNSISYYISEVENEPDKRYLYLPKYNLEEYRIASKLTFDCHLLSDSKTFDSLFIPDKTNLIGLLTNFQNHTGKYAIPGIKQQLGLLLHGPSGTGKTSLIKSIATMFNRNIVTIPLGLISTNYELFEIMFNLNYENNDKKAQEQARQMGMHSVLTKTLKFNELVFVIEDIDAIGNIVHDRENEKTYVVEEEQEQVQEQEQDETNDKLDHLSDTINILARRMATPIEYFPPMTADMSIGPFKKENKEKKADKLNLAGILNAIDGIVDAPGRIIIITSNFPEKLDRALIRPGRIDKIIKLDYIKENQAVEMCKHFFNPEEVDKNERSIREIISTHNFTPAQIEQYVLEVNNLSEFLIVLNSCKKNEG